MKQNRTTTGLLSVLPVLLLAFLILDPAARAQPGALDTTFNAGYVGGVVGVVVRDPVVEKILALPDGKILMGGVFAGFNGTPPLQIARLNKNGAPDTSFMAGISPWGTILQLSLQPDGKILIAGSFTNVSGFAQGSISRLDYAGNIDPDFAIGNGVNGSIEAMALQSDGKIILGGKFTNCNGIARTGLARLNSGGTLDTNFNPVLVVSGTGPTVSALTLQSNAKILIAGSFTNVNGSTRSNIARLNPDGSLDLSFNPGNGLRLTNAGTARINDMAVQPDGKIIIAGQFHSVGGVPRLRLARLNADGTVDTTFDPGTGTDNTVSTLALQPDGKILIGGFFAAYNGTSRTRLARLNSDGSLDTSFATTLAASIIINPFWVEAITLQQNGMALLGGSFASVNSTTRSNIARVTAITPSSNPPSILSEPLDTAVVEGANPALMVLAGGYPLSYQWQSDGTNLIGQTNAVLFFPSVTTNKSGGYNVIVSNTFGSVTSRVAQLTVSQGAPFFISQPFNANVGAGVNVSFSAAAYGLPQYQWFFNGAALAGKTNSLLTLPSVTGTNAGNYFLMASNSSGIATSYVAILNVTEIPPSITSQPTNQSALHGARVSISASVSGAPFPAPQWRKNGTNIPGATSFTYTINEANTNDTGAYDVIASSYLGAVTSHVAVLTVGLPTYLSGSWSTNSLTWVSGGNASWIVQTNETYDGGDALQSGLITNNQQTFVETQVTGPGLLTFWWKVSSRSGFHPLQFFTNGNQQFSISGEVDWQQRQVSIAPGPQTLRWSYSKNNTVSPVGQDKGWLDSVTFAVPLAPVILSGPSSQSVLQRGYTFLNTVLMGSAPFAYQWQYNNTDIPAATDASLTLANFQPSHVGNYRLVVSNSYGTVTSINAALTMRPLLESSVMRPLWQKVPGSVPWLPIDSNPLYRGVSYNPVTKNVLVVSRAAGTNIWVLNRETGAELRSLNISTSVLGGTFTLSMIGVADDGVVYAANLTEQSRTTPYRVYRWDDDSSNSVPALVWEGDPGSGTGPIRWGDTFDIRGSGNNTEIVIASGFGGTVPPQIAIITPANGMNSPATSINLPNESGGARVYSAAFGEGNTFWYKTSGGVLRRAEYDGNIATLLKTYSNVPFIVNLAFDQKTQRLAILVSEAPDYIRLYDVTDLNNPAIMDNEFVLHPFDYDNTFLTGSVDFGPDRVYVVDSNNGIIALKVAPTLRITKNLGQWILTWPQDSVLQSSAFVDGPYEDVIGVISPLTLNPTESQKFYRLREQGP